MQTRERMLTFRVSKAEHIAIKRSYRAYKKQNGRQHLTFSSYLRTTSLLGVLGTIEVSNKNNDVDFAKLSETVHRLNLKLSKIIQKEG